MGLLKETHFQDSTTIERVVTKEFRAIPEESSQGVKGSLEEEKAKVHPDSRNML